MLSLSQLVSRYHNYNVYSNLHMIKHGLWKTYDVTALPPTKWRLSVSLTNIIGQLPYCTRFTPSWQSQANVHQVSPAAKCAAIWRNGNYDEREKDPQIIPSIGENRAMHSCNDSNTSCKRWHTDYGGGEEFDSNLPKTAEAPTHSRPYTTMWHMRSIFGHINTS